MRNRDIVFALKMRNAAKSALSSFSSDFKAAARDAVAAAKQIDSVAQAFNRVGNAGVVSGAKITNTTTQMRTSLASLATQARTTQQALQAAYAVQPRATPRAAPAAAGGGRQGQGGAAGVNTGSRGANTMASAASSIGSGFDKARQSVLGLQTAVATLTALMAGGLGVKAVLDTADNYTQLQGQLRLVTKSQAELNAVYERSFSISQNTRQDLSATVNLYSRLAKSTESVGYSANTLLGVTETINKALATTPGPASSAQAALFQLSQGLATGTLRGEELNSVLEQAPRLAKAIADGMGVPVGSLRKLAEQNKITTETIVEALVKQKDVIDKEFGSLDKTAGQALTVLGNAVVDFVGRADKASGATSSFANMVTAMADRLRDPSLMAGAIRGMELFGSALSAVGTAVTVAVENIGLVVAAISALAVRAAFPIFAGMITGAVQLGSALVALASGAGLAATGFTALQLSLGVIGVALAAAAGAYAYLKTRTAEASAATEKFREAAKNAAKEGKSLTEVIEKMSDAERFRAFNELTVRLRSMTPEFEKTGRAVRGMFGEFDKAALKENAPFQQAMDAFNKSIREGKPDVETFVAAVNKIGAESGDKGIQARAVKITEYIKKFGEMAAEVKSLQTQIDALKPKAMDEALNTKPAIDGARALKAYTEQVKELNKVGGQNKELQSALDDVEKATSTYTNAVKELDRAYQAGAISGREYQGFLAGTKKAFEDVKQAVLGVTEAQKAMQKLTEQNRIDGMEDGRAKRIAEINQKYREQADTITKSVHDQSEKTKQLALLEQQRAVAIGNIDAAYKNGGFADRLRELENEQRLIGLVGEERDRMVKRLEVEAEARKAGVSDIQAYVNAYMQEYDKLKRLQESDSTFGRGFSNAMKSYINETKNVAKESEKLWSGVFSKLEDGFVEVVTTGKLNFQNFLQGLAQDFARFASRQLMNSLLQAVTNTTTGGATGGNLFSSLFSGIGSWFGGGSSSSGGGSAITVAATTATKAVSGLAQAATLGTKSFDGIPGLLTSALKGLGATDSGIAGFLGNISRESAFNPSATNAGSGAFGIAQWLGSRKQGLFDFAGTSTPSAQQQVDYIVKELKGSEGAALKMLQSSSSLSDGVNAGLRFERPEGWSLSNPFGAHDWGKRMSAAQGFSGGSVPTLNQGTVDQLNKNLGDITSSTSSVAPGLKSLDTNLTNTAASVGQSGTQLNNGVQQASTAMQQGGAQVGSALTTTAATTTVGGTAVGTGMTTAATQVTTGGAEVGAAFQTAAANISASGTGGGGGGLFGGIGNFFSGLFGGGGLTPGAGGLYHKGGLAGRASGMIRSVDPSVWAGARRFHKGGVPGLRRGEEAIIAKENEAILPTVRLPNGQFGVQAAGAGGAGGNVMTVGDINITQQSSGDKQMDEDHAKATGREVKAVFEGLMADWSQSQSRPGGVLYRRN